MADTRLRVPDQHLGIFKDLLTAPPQLLRDLATAIKKTPLRSLSLEEFATQVAESSGAPKAQALGAVRVLTSLHYLPEALAIPRDDLVDKVIEAIREDERIAPTERQVKSLRSFFNQVLFVDEPVGVLSKGSYLYTGNHIAFVTARIFTDLRPIFGTKPTAPLAALIQHVLELHVDKDGRHEDLHIALDATDIEVLEESLERAKAKQKALSAWAAGAGLNVLAIKREDNGSQ